MKKYLFLDMRMLKGFSLRLVRHGAVQSLLNRQFIIHNNLRKFFSEEATNLLIYPVPTTFGKIIDGLGSERFINSFINDNCLIIFNGATEVDKFLETIDAIK